MNAHDTGDTVREESPWFCPTCQTWVGWKHDVCFTCKTDRPNRPLRYVDVEKGAHKVTRWDRLKAKLGWFR